MQLNAYLTFNGSCEAAFTFYHSVLGGELAPFSRFGESPVAVGEEDKNRVMHVTLTFENNVLMGSDSMPGQPLTVGDNISLSLNIPQIMDMEKVFQRMAEGGTVTMPLQDTFWGARFGMLRDRFGVNWMFNCDLN
ncbi:MAG: glyoxalase/bleomycin resistance/extradiol dioxygenase family protein [Bacteroidia bacterium]|nr:glyoxalase/bleomycin resistance/extradiol dioxygenase family protein [Bacteroidia bacterium]MBP7260393.1 glyoxalase/bleomycin resistance/extradiol dioxygenase family protein [Bacteroidia bacterium]MBP9180156.1 glyoxalase/bleomycin resistance/extradiol dioxygenase family protein [Bacteroidia bacterium]MBP9724283.1 glyoxalase/bleomycin resistance/extradiol dioxygenase family protein [Bacteroidia bacterium]